MKGMFVNSDGIKYAEAIVGRFKTIETRNRNTLGPLVGERVAVVRTGRGKCPMVIGDVFVVSAQPMGRDGFEIYRDWTLIPPGSKYDCPEGGKKWMYFLAQAEACEPYPLPANAVRHGRSWCEWDGAEEEYPFEEEYVDPGEREYIRSVTGGDYGPGNPWAAPGMSARDFI